MKQNAHYRRPKYEIAQSKRYDTELGTKARLMGAMLLYVDVRDNSDNIFIATGHDPAFVLRSLEDSLTLTDVIRHRSSRRVEYLEKTYIVYRVLRVLLSQSYLKTIRHNKSTRRNTVNGYIPISGCSFLSW